MNKKRILITGGFGFIGAHLGAALAKRDFHVVLFDNAVDIRKDVSLAVGLDKFPNVQRIPGSIMDINQLQALGEDFTYIIHAAGILGIKRVVEEPLLTMDVNIIGSRNVLEFGSTQQNLERFIQFSTSEVYGQNTDAMDEGGSSVIPLDGERWCYATSKLACEYFARSFISKTHLPGVIVRPFNVYGPYRYGSNAFTTLIQRALTGQVLKLSGNGQQTRSWCHINDFITGIQACLFAENIIGESFNLGNDQNNVSMLELSKFICNVLGSSSNIETDGVAGEDVEFRKPNIEKAKRLLAYLPCISLEEGIRDVAVWLNQQHS
jgi:nucleoside-diphosphate-sugar epimerase